MVIHGGVIDGDEDSAPLGEGLVDENSIHSHGDSLGRSGEFFGASDTVSGATEPQPGDPRVPRHLPMEVRVEMRFLLETLKHELQQERPADALWGGFAVDDLLLRPSQSSGQPPTPDREARRAILRELVDAFQQGDDARVAAVLAGIPPSLTFSTRAWNGVKNYAFLEFYLSYAYNDYTSYGDAPFANEHEIDLEGCCVVFERRSWISSRTACSPSRTSSRTRSSRQFTNRTTTMTN